MKKGDVRFRGFTGLVFLILLFNYACQGPPVESPDGNVRIVGNQSADHLGRSVAAVGHVNPESQGKFTDILVGAPSFDDEGLFSDRGAAYLIYGNRFPPSLVTPSSQDPEGPLPDITFLGSQNGGSLGFSGAGIGDVNGDGFDDFLIGAPLVRTPFSAGSNENGTAYLVFGGDKLKDKIEKCEMISQCACIEESEDLNFKCLDKGDPRMRVLVSDVDGLIRKRYTVVMSPNTLEKPMITYLDPDDPNAPPQNITNPLFKLAFILRAGTFFSHFGFSLAGVGDVNGDGCPDFLIGAPFNSADRSGAAYLYTGSGDCNGGSDLLNATVTEPPENTIPPPNPNPPPINPVAVFTGVRVNEHLGLSLSGLGSVNGDSFADFIIGAPNEVPQTGFFARDINISTTKGCRGIGYAYLFLGRTTPLDMASADADVSIQGSFKTDGQGNPILSDNDCFGISVSGLGDTNGDNLPDFIIGAPLADINSTTEVPDPNEGSAYLFYGDLGMGLTITSLVAGDADQIFGGSRNNEFLGGSVAGSPFSWTGLPGSSVPGCSLVPSLWDINGDCLSDLAIGATNASSGGGIQNGAPTRISVNFPWDSGFT